MSKPEEIAPTEERKYLIRAIWITFLILLLIGIIIAILLFAWPGWFKPEPAVMGCTSDQWTPDGKLEVFTDQEISPDDAWICVATSPEGPFNWERYQVEKPEIENPPTEQTEETNQSLFQEVPNCQENSDWSMDTKWTLNASGVPGHDLSPVGSLESTQWLLFETHRDSSSGEVLETFVGAIPAGHVMWLSGHAGGTGWYICVSSMEELQDKLQQHADNLLQRDGIKQTIVVLPEDISLIDSILEKLQTEPLNQ